jgi:hypothetical protein
MVSRARAPLGAPALRALNLPVQLVVQADDAGQPQTVRRADWRSPRIVTRVQDCWRIDDEWWREEPISRLYFVVLLEHDALLTVYHDLISDGWYEQRG